MADKHIICARDGTEIFTVEPMTDNKAVMLTMANDDDLAPAYVCLTREQWRSIVEATRYLWEILEPVPVPPSRHAAKGG